MGSGAPVISVVVPAYNEADHIDELCARLRQTLGARDDAYELLFVDDGSTDDSAAAFERITRDDDTVRVVTLTRSFGQHAAVWAGFRHCRGEIVVLMDADLQNPPEEIPRLLGALADGNDIAYGIRSDRRDSRLRRAGSRLTQWVMRRLMPANTTVNVSSFRAMRRPVIEALDQFEDPMPFLAGLVGWLGFREVGVEVSHEARKHGRSRYGMLRLMLLWYDMICSISITPLRMVGFLGFLFALVGFVFGIVIFVRTVMIGTSVPGWASMIVAIAFFSGVQLVCIGILGEYLARVFLQVRKRPLYVVRDVRGDHARSRGVEPLTPRAEPPPDGEIAS
jgi:undecaprenyl-phosphate 4-deoxy-4-formamido-L-arabinose transferase